MSELARQRNARDIWISRGHLYAMAAGGALAVLASFAAGYGAGRQSVELPATPSQRFAGEAGDDALVQLLARVDASATPDGGVLELTFPDALAGRDGVGADTDAAGAPLDLGEGAEGVALEGGTAEPPFVEGGAPEGRWTVAAIALASEEDARRVAEDLKSRELEAWVGVEQLEGQTRYRVSVGGWGSRIEAEKALPSLQDTIQAAGGRAEVVRY